MLIKTPEEIRKAEELANKNVLSYGDMMESAGMGCAKHIIKNYSEAKNTVILCGKGKNGGDGFVIARGLRDAKKNVNVILTFKEASDELSEKKKKLIDGTVNIFDGTHITKNIISLLTEADIIIDAVFGIGFKGTLPENIKELFLLSKKSGALKVAVDIPSGLSVNNDGFSDCFRADETLSMLCFKKEHIYKPYSDLCGKVFIIPIGFALLSDGIEAKTSDEIKASLPERPYNSNKGTFGKALIIAGSYKMPGAAVIAAKGSLISGAGLTYLAFPDRIYNTVTAHLTECVFRPLPSSPNGSLSEEATKALLDEIDSFSAVAIGPGITTDKGAEILLISLLKNYKGRLIIDADGINIISRNIDILKESQAQIVLTPHPMEMSRLTGIPVKEINSHREEIATEFAKKYGVTLLLKGANTVIASPDGKVFINPTGASSLSRGGSGDLLTGIIVSLAAQGMNANETAVAGAYIHGLAGEIAEKKFTSYGATVEYITECVPKALSKIISGK